jgi:hypothetical protein
MQFFKRLVYAKTAAHFDVVMEEALGSAVVEKYPKTAARFGKYEKRRSEVALYARKDLVTRGNNTNNLAEAGIKIAKEQVWKRVMAYNLCQVFLFITGPLERYYEQRLLAVASNRPDFYIGARFVASELKRVNSDLISIIDWRKKLFKVPSLKSENVYYLVDMLAGICESLNCLSGSPCPHQALVVLKYRVKSLNFIPYLSAEGRRDYSVLALGPAADPNPAAYAHLHQAAHDAHVASLKLPEDSGSEEEEGGSDGLESAGNPFPLGTGHHTRATDEPSDAADGSSEDSETEDGAAFRGLNKNKLLQVVNDMQRRAKGDPTFGDAVNRFTSAYLKTALTEPASLRLTSWLHDVKKKTVKRAGKAIPVQATAQGRRAPGKPRGSAPVPSGRPRQTTVAASSSAMPNRSQKKHAKRPHNLQKAVTSHWQNGGKF